MALLFLPMNQGLSKGRIILFKRIVTFLIFLSLVFPFLTSNKVQAAELQTDRIVITVKASPSSEYSSSLEITYDRKLMKSLTKNKSISTNLDPELPYAYLTVMYRKKRSDYVVDSPLRVFYKDEKKLLQLTPETQNKLLKYIKQTENKHFGEMIAWNQVQEMFPRKSRAQVTDLETGLTFTVERRAGSHHADVQPVTKEDTYTMKEIYNGKWSWKRRAILVQIGDKKIAASMNGMPHGAGAIQGNDFPGHFCIHFEGSTTHRSRKQDFGHHLMIVKAAGQLNTEIINATPVQLVNIGITALDQHDFYILQRTLDRSNDQAYKRFLEKAKDIQEIRLLNLDDEKENFNLVNKLGNKKEVEIPAKISIYGSSYKKEIRKTVLIKVKHDSLMNRWKIDVESLESLLPK
jgi:hypothetical protein